MIIKGRFNEAKVFAKTIEDGAINQIKEILDIEAFKNSKIRIMPDVHQGAGCVIGFTANLLDKVIPNIVGVDIGCGMLTVELGKVNLNFSEIDSYIRNNIPYGKEINLHKEFDFIDEIQSLYCIREIKGKAKQWNRGIGSLGGGNHFIEFNEDEDGIKYLVIHSGSRNLGHRVASHYQKVAISSSQGLDNSYYEQKEMIIKTYKEQNRKADIQDALKLLRNNFKKEMDIPEDLCYLEGKMMDEYLHDMRICQEYAVINRNIIAKKILEFIFGHNNFSMFHTIHNYIDFEDNTVRKGAIKAYKDELVLIPINMRDGSILAKGKGNLDWNNSAPHGAGRILSRSQAKEVIKLEDYQKSMKGIYTTCVNEATLDESPMAYKSIDEILSVVTESVDIIKILKPIYNFKAQ